MDDGRDYYEILQVHPRAGQEVIQRAYRTLSRMYHPDANPSGKRAWAQEMMSRLNEAYRVLSDPEKRQEYDARRDEGSSSSLRNGRQRGKSSASTAVRSCHWHPQRARVSICTVCGRSICAECRRTDGMAVVCPECQGKTRSIEEHTEASSHPKRMRGESPKRSGIAAALRELRHTDVLIQAAFVILHLAIGALALSLWIRGLILLVAFRFPGNLHLVWPLAIGASIVTIAGIGVILTSARTFRRPGLIVTGGFILSLLALLALYNLSSSAYADRGHAAREQEQLSEAIKQYSFALWIDGQGNREMRRRLGLAYLAGLGDRQGVGGSILASGALVCLTEHSSPKALRESLEGDSAEPPAPIALSRDEILTLYQGAETVARRNARLTWTRTASVLTRVPSDAAGTEFRGVHAACLGLSFAHLSHAVRGMPEEALRRADDEYIGLIDRILDKEVEAVRGPLEQFYRKRASKLLNETVQMTAFTVGLGRQVEDAREELGFMQAGSAPSAASTTPQEQQPPSQTENAEKTDGEPEATEETSHDD